MTEPSASRGAPLVVVIDDEEWATRSIESILGPQGYAVLPAFTGRQELSLAARTNPDLILVDIHLPDIAGIELCARLRAFPLGDRASRSILLTSGAVSRGERLEAYSAGAWEVLQPPFDPQELLARVEPYIRAKRDVDQALEGVDVNPLTGCYNARGLMRRLQEVIAMRGGTTGRWHASRPNPRTRTPEA